MKAGDLLKPFRIASVSPEGMKAWARFLHDPNPIHLDPAMVKAKGLGDRVINQGPANLAYLINMLQTAIPNGFIESLEVRYVDNVFGGEAVEAGGTVKDISAHAVTRRISCDVWLRADARGAVLTGTASVLIPV
ncbi:MAG TPA: MaoC family dehydratase [Steroidobacteraceae bacterium]|jgi:acyl dehydratase|nr:MaoC family dehydratase [Steroidobacteraceae bacterium]